MNDLPVNICHSQIALFAVDIAVYVTNADTALIQAHINSNLASLSQWATTNGVKINISKCQSMVLARRHWRSQASIKFLINNVPLLPQKCVKYLGVLVDQDLNWSQQVSHISRKSLATLALVRRVSSIMPTKVLLSLYNAFVLPHLTYCCMVWHFCSNTLLSENLQRVQNFAMRIILKKPARTSSNFCLTQLGWSSLFQRCCIALLWQVHKCFLHLAPAYFMFEVSHKQSIWLFSHTWEQEFSSNQPKD